MHRVHAPAVAGVRRAERPGAPLRERAQDGVELTAVLGQLVHGDRPRRRQFRLADDPRRLEVAEAGREDVRADAGERLGEIRVAPLTQHQLTHDRGAPSGRRPGRARGRRGSTGGSSSQPYCMPLLEVRLSALFVRKTVLSNSKPAGYVLGLNDPKGDALMVASGRHKWLALALLSVVQFMLVLDIAIVNVALAVDQGRPRASPRRTSSG